MSLTFPFSALVGQEELKLCLALAAVDWRLSCLIRGDKGSGKSTAARGLAEILPGASPFVNVPIGVTEDRLLGGLNLEKAFEHSAALKPGLVHEAHGGVLYIDEVNLLAGHLTDALLDVSATGRYVLERDGFSQTYDSRFVLLGSMNQEEGSLRPQLLDRFALALDVHAPLQASDRLAVLEARQRFDENPGAFRHDMEQDQMHWRETIAAARDRLADVNVGRDLLLAATEAITAAGVRSLRADLAAVRAATALAALEQRASVQEEDIGKVLPLVLLHRAVNRPPSPPGHPPPPPDHAETGREQETSRPQTVRVFAPEPRTAPRLRKSPLNGTAMQRECHPRGNADPERIDVFSSLQNSAKHTGDVVLRPQFVVNRRTSPSAATRYVFAVDCSGSQAARQRMRTVKGMALGLIAASFHSGDEIAVITFRGPRAEVLVEPSRDVALIERQLELVATGGRTPLADALQCALRYLDPTACFILLTDGRANVPLNGGDAWQDAIDVARQIHCPALVLDTSIDDSPRATGLAQALRAVCHKLDEIGEGGLLSLIRGQL